MRLVSVYDLCDSPATLYRLLAEREPHVNISHQKMPTPTEHMAFFCSKPYLAWYLIYVEGDWVGACYLSKQREVGIQIFSEHQRRGHGAAALKALMALHPGRFLANIAPMNWGSREFFYQRGFRPLQVTYEHS